MLLPVRCITCNKVIGNRCQMWDELSKTDMPIPIIFNTMKIERMCCKRMFLTHVDVESEMAEYTNLPHTVTRTESIDRARVYRAR